MGPTNLSADERLSQEETRERLQCAALTEYDHGGGRLYFELPDGRRDLIADFYGAGHYRDFIMRLIREHTLREVSK